MSLISDNVKSNVISYSDVTSKKVTIEKTYVPINELKSAGWCIMKKEKNKITIEKESPIINKRYLMNVDNIKEFKIKENNMINNWNKFRDEENSLYGDLSLYINYKEELKRLIEEEEKIMEEITKRENNDSDSEYNSDSDKF